MEMIVRICLRAQLETLTAVRVLPKGFGVRERLEWNVVDRERRGAELKGSPSLSYIYKNPDSCQGFGRGSSYVPQWPSDFIFDGGGLGSVLTGQASQAAEREISIVTVEDPACRT
jgi:hypothetical protein